MEKTTIIIVILFVFIQANKAYVKCPKSCKCKEFFRNQITDGTDVDCSGKKLEKIPSLEYNDVISLDVSFNMITSINISEYGVWARTLKYLNLHHNIIHKINISTFRPLTKLYHIRLDRNSITSIDSNAFQNKHMLWKLVLNGNPLILPNDSDFLNIPSLGWLEMDYCNIEVLPLNIFHKMNRLVYVTLRHNFITHIEPVIFSGLHRLRYLHLENNAISRIEPETFSNTSIEWLYLSENPIKHHSNGYFLHSESILLLDLSFCELKSISSYAFSNLINLKKLNLHNNELEYFEISEVPPKLEVLDISANYLNMLGLSIKTKKLSSNLKYFDLSENNFTCDCSLENHAKLCSNNFKKCLYINECKEFDFSSCYSDNLSKQRSLPLKDLGFDSNNSFVDNFNHSNTEEAFEDYDIEVGPDTNITRQDVEYGLSNHSGDIEPKNKYVNEQFTERNSEEGTLNIVIYSVIGFLGILCVLGAAALVVDMCLGFGRNRSRSSSESTVKQIERQINMEEDIQEQQPLRPVSILQRFDYVSPRTRELPEVVPQPEIVPQHSIRRSYRRRSGSTPV
jgi:Leucine-rich repeat (LRR) protein